MYGKIQIAFKNSLYNFEYFQPYNLFIQWQIFWNDVWKFVLYLKILDITQKEKKELNIQCPK